MDARAAFYPHSRTATYPKHLRVDFRKLKPSSLRRYLEALDVPARPDASPAELAAAVARHFENHLEVDEDTALSRFMNAARRLPPAPAVGDFAGKRASRRAGAEDDGPAPPAGAPPANAGAGAGARGRGRYEEDAGDDDPPQGRRRGGEDDEERRGPAHEVAPPGKRLRHDENEAGGGGGGGGVERPPPGVGGRRGTAAEAARAARAAFTTSVVPAEEAAGGEHEEQGSSQVVDEADDTVYCLCQQTSYGEMIGCDNDHCPYEWFHLQCVGLSTGTRPKGKWFCPNCRWYDASGGEGDFRRIAPNPPNRVAPQQQRARGAR